MNIFKKSIACATLAAGLFVSFSSNAWVAANGTPVGDREGAMITLLSIISPVIGPLLQELNVPPSDQPAYLHNQATRILAGNSIYTGNLIAALAQTCGLDEKIVAERVQSIYVNNEQVAGSTCDVLKVNL